MAYEIEVVAWQGHDYRRWGVRHDPDGTPILPPPERVHGVKILATNPSNRGDSHQFWTYSLTRFPDWNEWFVLITGVMASHGMDLADEPGDYGDFYPPEEPPDESGPVEPPPPEKRKKTIRERISRIAITIGKWFK